MRTVESTCESAELTSIRKPTLREFRWTGYVSLCICAILLCWLYAPTFKWWYSMWTMEESNYSHGILVPVISGFLIWLNRARLRQTVVEPYPLGYVLLVLSLLAMVTASWAGPGSLIGLTFPIVLGCLVLVSLGRSVLRELSFPIGYLFFMCVLPGYLLIKVSFRIQMLSTTGATFLLRLMTLNAVQEGVFIHLPYTSVQIGAACSGFRLLVSLVAFTVLFIYLKEGPLWGKGALLVSVLPLSVILNSIRIAMIALVGHFMGDEAMHKFHDYSGYIMLILAFGLLSLLARLVKCRKFNSMLLP